MYHGGILLFLALLIHLAFDVLSIAILPSQVSTREHNIVLTKEGWKQINFTKQYEQSRPPPPFDNKHKSLDSTIVVLISSLRETRLAATVHALFSKAQNPHRVFVAIVQQNSPEDADIVDEYCRTVFPLECTFASHLRVIRMLASKAKGPVFARALGNKLVNFATDDFCMQIDAHTLVVPRWDTLLLEDWGRAQNEFAILTTYPSNAKNDLGRNVGGLWSMPHLCCVNFDQIGIMTNCQANGVGNLDAPLLSPVYAAGFSLSKCHAEHHVPNDPELVGVFAGEEYARGVRLWTHGYDFYSNTRPWIATYYGDDKGSKSMNWDETDVKKSHARMHTLYRMPGSNQSQQALDALGIYGLGTRRTLEQYIAFSGINPHTQLKHARSPSRCAPVFVPWYTAPRVGFQHLRKPADHPYPIAFGRMVLLTLGILLATFSLLVQWVRKCRRQSKRRGD